MFIETAWAQTGAASGGSSLLAGWAPILIIFAVFYFLVIRPQQTRAKEHDEMVKNLRRGDRVVTNAGIHGEVTKVEDENTIRVKIADGVEIHMSSHAVSALIDKGIPMDKAEKKTAKPAKKSTAKKKSTKKK